MTSHWAQTAPAMCHDLGPGGQLQPRQFLRWPTAPCCVPAFQQLGGRTCSPEGRRGMSQNLLCCFRGSWPAGSGTTEAGPCVPSSPQPSLASEQSQELQNLLGHQAGLAPLGLLLCCGHLPLCPALSPHPWRRLAPLGGGSTSFSLLLMRTATQRPCWQAPRGAFW